MQIPEMHNIKKYTTEADLLYDISMKKSDFIKEHNMSYPTFLEYTKKVDEIIETFECRSDQNLIVQYYSNLIETTKKRQYNELNTLTGDTREEQKSAFDAEIKSLYSEKNTVKLVYDFKQVIGKTLEANKDIPLTVTLDTGKFNTKYTYHEIDSWGVITFTNFISDSFPSRVKKYELGTPVGKEDTSIYMDGIEWIVGPSSDRIYKGHTDVDAVTTKAHRDHRILCATALDKIVEKTGRTSFNVIFCYSADQYGVDKGAEVALTVLDIPLSDEETEELNKLDGKARGKRLNAILEEKDSLFPISMEYEKGEIQREILIYDIIMTPETLSGVLSPRVQSLLEDTALRDVFIKDIGGLNSTSVAVKGSLASARISANRYGMIDVYTRATKYIKSNNFQTGGLSTNITSDDIERILRHELPELYKEEYEKHYPPTYEEALKKAQDDAKKKKKKSPNKLGGKKLVTVDKETDEKALKSSFEIIFAKYKVLVDFFNEYLEGVMEDLNDGEFGFNYETTELVFIGGGSSEVRVFIKNYFDNVVSKKLSKDIVIPRDSDDHQLIYANAEGSYTGFFGEFREKRIRRERALREAAKKKQKQVAAL